MIQILGLRPYKQDGTIKLSEKFFTEGWRAPSVTELFMHIEDYIDKIPENERYNLYYTAASCKESPGRSLIGQNIIPFDIDGIDLTKIDEYVALVLDVLKVEYNATGIVASGNGLQILIQIKEIITDEKYFNENRHHYKKICENINEALKSKDLEGHADVQVWSAGRLLRLPCTDNIKTPEAGFKNKNSVKKATLLQRNIQECDFTLEDVSGIPRVKPDAQVDTKELKRYPKPETEYVLNECNFLRDCKAMPNDVAEEDWYKMLSIVARLENGHQLCHEMSEGYDDYDEHTTDAKIEQALKSSGPRTCDNIGETYNCSKCPHFQKVTSPITLQSENYIKTKLSGYRDVKLLANGSVVSGKVNYEDLMKGFIEEHDFISSTSGNIFLWRETHWEMIDLTYIDSFMEKKVKPAPVLNECREFRAKLQRNKLSTPDFFDESIERRVNVKNGILDFRTPLPILLPHDKDMGFLNVLPYEYSPESLCPNFDAFMAGVTQNRQELVDVLLEYAGYAFINEECKHEKALVLLGEGSNGKSTFMNVLTALAGPNTYSTIPLTKLDIETHVASLQGKLFNITEETPKKSFIDSSAFKNICSGGDISVRQLYGKPYLMKTKAKLILACNELPKSTDITHGMTRRLLIVPFNARFEGKSKNKGIRHELNLELSGILNRIIEGYVRLSANDNFTNSDDVTKEIESFVHQNDNVFEYYKDFLDKSSSTDNELTVQQIYTKYTDVYCEQAGVRQPLTRKALMKELTRHIPDMEKRKCRKSSGYVIKGLAFIEENTSF